jgi:metallophosphoesterase superfamily enzyme
MVGREFTWVLGNHDPLLPDFLNGTQSLSSSIGKIELRHQIELNDPNTMLAPADGQIIAHYHPKAKLRLRAGTASGKCFIFDTYRMILPAFGVFTGGLNIRDKTISSLFSQPPEICFCHRTKLYHIRDVANLCK